MRNNITLLVILVALLGTISFAQMPGCQECCDMGNDLRLIVDQAVDLCSRPTIDEAQKQELRSLDGRAGSIGNSIQQACPHSGVQGRRLVDELRDSIRAVAMKDNVQLVDLRNCEDTVGRIGSRINMENCSGGASCDGEASFSS